MVVALARATVVAALILLLTSCAPWAPAPVEDRSERTTSSRPAARPLPAPPVYEVRRGDTLYSIAFRYGLDWRSVAAWNLLREPYLIRPGQELRMTEPPRPVAAVSRPPATTESPRQGPSSSGPVNRLPDSPGPSRPEPAPPRAEPSSGREAARAPAPAAAPASGSRTVAGVVWRWPTAGEVARPFDASAARRGLGLRGQAGQAVVAAADGEVVYSGTALIGYGELIIIKHSGTMLSAYGHNRRRLVEEGVQVRAGQTIAEMGLDETDEAILHFEIRRNGDPVNPLDFLPPRR